MTKFKSLKNFVEYKKFFKNLVKFKIFEKPNLYPIEVSILNNFSQNLLQNK